MTDAPPGTLDMIDPAFVDLLRCPVTRQPLTVAPAEILARVNARRGERIAAGLLRQDGTAFYPMRDGIPVLLAEAAIVL